MRLSHFAAYTLIAVLCFSHGGRLRGQSVDQQQATLHADGRAVSCRIWTPRENQGVHAILLLPSGQGLQPSLLVLAEQLASQGHTLLLPDLQAHWPHLEQAPGSAVRAVLIDLMDHAASYRSDRGRLVVMGMGWGGTQAFGVATRSRQPEAVVVFGGRGPQLAAYCARISAPVYGFYGGARAETVEQVEQLNRYMVASGKTYEPVIFPQAQPGFMLREASAGQRLPEQRARVQALKKLRALLLQLERPSAMR